MCIRDSPQDRAVGYAMLRRLFPQDGGNIVHHPRQLNTEPLRLLFRKNDPESALSLIHI